MRRAALVLVLALSGCGSAAGLRPAPGKSLPVAPRGDRATPTPAALLKATTQERPLRSDDLLTAAEARRSDAFDLPPGNGN